MPEIMKIRRRGARWKLKDCLSHLRLEMVMEKEGRVVVTRVVGIGAQLASSEVRYQTSNQEDAAIASSSSWTRGHLRMLLASARGR